MSQGLAQQGGPWYLLSRGEKAPQASGDAGPARGASQARQPAELAAAHRIGFAEREAAQKKKRRARCECQPVRIAASGVEQGAGAAPGMRRSERDQAIFELERIKAAERAPRRARRASPCSPWGHAVDYIVGAVIPYD